MQTIRVRTAARLLAGAAGAAVMGYAGYAAIAWLRYGSPPAPGHEDAEARLDRFMPVYDVVERHRIAVAAPADVTLQAAGEADMTQSRAVRAIVRARELVLGAGRDRIVHPRGLLALTTSLGWAVLEEVPGREIVVGAVTRPWEANVVFRAVPAEAFAAFAEPDYVKIVWTLRADPAGPRDSIFRTETRAVATDAAARLKFRRYWSFLSPGIIAIRWLSLRPIKADAERRSRGVTINAA
jgi:hypothetical protein